MIKLIRLFGVDIFLHWTLLLLMAILFPTIYPIINTHISGGMIVGGLITLALCVAFVGSVLWHELAHSLMGKCFGIVMDQITLFIFGGAASIKGELKRPSHEFWVSLAGPVSSVVLGFVFLVIAVLFQGYRTIELFCSMLASVNVVLGIFNLIPAFPCDGGRIVRAFVWWITKSYRKATMFAGTLGKVFAGGFVACGLMMACGINIPFFGTGFFNGMWIGFIGWIIYKMANNEMEAIKRIRNE